MHNSRNRRGNSARKPAPRMARCYTCRSSLRVVPGMALRLVETSGRGLCQDCAGAVALIRLVPASRDAAAESG